MKPRLSASRANLSDSPGVRAFHDDVLHGLLQPVRELSCKYFYDAHGSRLFERICSLPEYYLTRTELAIMDRHAGAMARRLQPHCLLIEFGSGSSRKTRLLLDHLDRPAAYVPVDISGAFLEQSAAALRKDYPALTVAPLCADFTQPLQLPPLGVEEARRVVYFPGSTIGNFTPAQAKVLLEQMRKLCGPDGGLLLGVDLKKDPATLERAYNDAQGVTAAFNLNLLRRINRELGADFDLEQFCHRAVYNVAEGRIEMYLISTIAQTVHIGDVEITFAEGERICTEYSHKYGIDELRRLAPAGMNVQQVWTDEQRLFSVQYLAAAAEL